jgi:hypothetical protein
VVHLLGLFVFLSFSVLEHSNLVFLG